MENLENIHNIADTAEQDAEETISADAAAETTPAGDMARLIEEAEQRGYLRGRNEKIAETIGLPDEIADPKNDNEYSEEPCPSFLAHIRPGFWDN